MFAFSIQCACHDTFITFFFLLYNSLHCQLVANSFYVLHTQKITTSHNDRFSFNPMEKIINKPFDPFNAQNSTEDDVKNQQKVLFLSFLRFHQICFLCFFKNQFLDCKQKRRAPKQVGWLRCNLHLKFGSEKTLLQPLVAPLYSMEFLTFVSRIRFNSMCFVLDFMAQAKSSCVLKRRLISDKNFTSSKNKAKHEKR